MVNILVERDKVMETLKETQDQLINTKNKLNEIEKERDSLQNQLNDSLPQDFSSLTRELNQTRKQLNEKDEELQELKAERNNTRLLLEHLECLVSRHERGLRMTVAKRQSRTPAGVSSEVEVLKALKSLFEHHKALDEKVREKLRCSLERINQLEEELAKAQEEAVKAKNAATENGDIKEESNNANSLFKLSITESEVQEMKTLIEKQSDELLSSRIKIQELTVKMKELDELFKSTETQLVSVKDENFKLKDLLKENNAQKLDQEQRISTLEDRYLNSQRESTSLHDINEKLNHEIKNKDAQLKLANEKIDALKEKIELTEQKLTQLELSKKQELLVKEATENHHKDQEHKLSLEERIQRLENQLEEKSSELHRARQREKMNEEHNQRLSATVDKLLAESNERLQQHLKERMSALEEKNSLQQELEKTRKQLDETQTENQKGLLEQSKLKTEMDTLRQDIQQYKSDQYPFSKSNSKKSAINLYHEREWERVENNLNNNLTNHHNILNSHHLPASYDASESDSGQQTDDNDSLFGTMNGFNSMQNNATQNDAQALALMLQEQLDQINNEIRLIQEEKQNTEQRTEELESQVGSIDSMNLLSRAAGNHTYESQHLMGISPTHNEKSSPKPSRISPNRDIYSQLILPNDIQQQQQIIYSQIMHNNVHNDSDSSRVISRY